MAYVQNANVNPPINTPHICEEYFFVQKNSQALSLYDMIEGRGGGWLGA